MREFKAVFLLSSLGLALAGCTHERVPFLSGPSSYLVGPNAYMSDSEVEEIAKREDPTKGAGASVFTSPEQRNRFVAARMYIIDRNYYAYESSLGRENEYANFAGSVASLGVSTAGATIPLGQTTKILAAVATGITGAKASFDRDVLLTQTIQAVQSQMRTDRALQAKVLLSRMSCGVDEYPVFIAMSDLETYRQAGTLEAAMSSLTKAAAKAEADATAKSLPKNNAKDMPKNEVDVALAAIVDAHTAVSKLKRDCPIKLKRS